MKRSHYYLKTGLALFLLWGMSGSSVWSQTELPKNVRINGLGRTLIQSTNLGGTLAETDTTTATDLLDGEFLLDLQVNASPNEQTEVQSIIRLRNEFGGFFGSGMTVEVRELFARGVAGNIFKYHVGDMNLKMTPYTLFQVQQEGTVHQPEIFKARQELIDYEQFYNGDGTRRMQGARFDLGLSAGAILPEINLTGFMTRIRGTDFFTLPSRLVGGGSVELVNDRWGSLTGTYVNTYDALAIGNFTAGIRNPVQTISANLHLVKNKKLALDFVGEMGQSSIREVDMVDPETPAFTFDKDDTFGDGALALSLVPQRLNIKLGFRNIGPDFFSIGAQSKRVDFTRSLETFNRIGNQKRFRQLSLWDINRDRSIYTFGLSDVLMAYDSRFGITQPYGQATPNRRGLYLEGDFFTSDSSLNVGAQVMRMSEIRGQGTFELKAFNLARLWSDIHIHKWINREEAITLTLGLQYEQASRGGNDIQQIDLTNVLLETGLQFELIESLDLLVGLKNMTSNGSDYLPQIVRFNEVRDFPARYTVDDTESMLAAGIRYRFKEGVYLNIQWERFSGSRASDAANDYGIDQIFILYNMNF